MHRERRREGETGESPQAKGWSIQGLLLFSSSTYSFLPASIQEPEVPRVVIATPP